MHSNSPPLDRSPVPAASFWSLSHRGSAVVTEGGRSLSYGDLQQEVDAIRSALSAPLKSLVFILCSHSIPSLAAYIACLQEGHAALLLPQDLHSSLLAPLLEAYRPEFVWTGSAPPGESHAEAGFCMDGYRMYRICGSGESPPIHPDLALMLTTSGSTGNPKVVRLSYANLQANAGSIAEYLEIGPRDRPVTSLPMNYSYGLSVINSHLLRGCTLLQTPARIRTPEFWKFARTYGATSLAGVPYLYQILHEIGFESRDLPSLRTFTQAGGHLDAALQAHFIHLAKQRGIRYYTMYGQTEATARISYVPSDRAEEGKGSIGIPIPGGKFEIEDGELVYSGPNVMLGYAENREELAKGDELGGRLFTGDMARIAENGLCYIVGRKKRFVKPMGLRINLDDVERQLTEHLNHRCVVLGTDCCLHIISTRAGVESSAIDFIRHTYHLSSKLCRVSVVPEIPVLATGKVDYSTLNALAFHAPDRDVIPFDAGYPVAAAV